MDEESNSSANTSQSNMDSTMIHTTTQIDQHDYVPIQPYWFHSRKNQDQLTWIPFSLIDVQRLEQGYNQKQEIVATNGNRCDVNLVHRTHTPIYWIDQSNEVRRCRWSYSTAKDSQLIPLDESTDEILEKLYMETCRHHSWHVKHSLNEGNVIVIFHNSNHMSYEIKSPTHEIRILKRGLPETFLEQIPSDEKETIQHVCFVVHGIGAACDIKFRSLIECVEDLRQTSRTLLHNHFKSYLDNEQIHRIEFLPIYWHGDLHLESTGVDNHLLPITLPSVFKLRTFINTTLADILFYASPIYCQRIITRCVNEMNRLYRTFIQRNPTFKGQISVIGHSLGSVILYDILSNQKVESQEDVSKKVLPSTIEYGQLEFPIAYFFALGSPIAMFLTVRGITSIEIDYTLPTCKGLFNIFHPYDPIAYRLEPLIDPGWKVSPVLLSHHKGRKRIHLEIADRFSKASDLKRKMVGVFKDTVTSLSTLVESYTNPATTSADTIAEAEHANDDEDTHVTEWDNRPIGKLNQGRRIDYVLQHGPIEAINEYIFAFASHVSYWCSEDTMLLILKEILQIDGFEAETRFETLEQMIKSNVLYCFPGKSTDKSALFRSYMSTKMP